MSDDAVSIAIDPAFFPFVGHLAPGVLGYTVERDGELWVPLIHAENEGAGAVGRYLDALPADRPVVVPNVVSSRLAGMLERRGFVETGEPSEDGEVVPCWRRPPPTYRRGGGEW